VTAEEGRIFVEDLGSKNGTFLNGERITGKKEVIRTDVLKIADLEMKVSFPEPEKRPEPKAAPKSTVSAEDKKARLAKKQEQEMLRKIIIGSVLAVIVLGGLIWLKGYVPPEQEEARLLLKEAEDVLFRVEIGRDVEENALVREKLESLKVKLQKIHPDFKTEYSKSQALIRQIADAVQKIEAKNTELASLKNVKKRFDAISAELAAGIITPQQAKRINAVMLTCGHYDASGDFAFHVGLPGKSGVGGGIVAVIPKAMGIAVWSPGLNAQGNSLVGTKALELFTTKTGMSIF